jgi:hypothetical protein
MSCVTSKRKVRNVLVSRNSCVVDSKPFDATGSYREVLKLLDNFNR